MTKKRFKLGCLVSLLGLLLPPFLMFFIVVGFMTTSSSHGSSGCPIGISTTSTSGELSSSSASESDWTKEGTVAYNNAKYTFEKWVSLGLDGGAAAGVVGWINSEGGFAMVGRAEGHFGNSLEENSIAYGNKPLGLAYYTTEAGGGIYMITPYTKYAPLGSPDWEDIDKMTNFVFRLIREGDWNASMDMSGQNRSFRQMAQESDPKSATLAWQAYERGNPDYIHVDQKQADAQKAYELFNGAKYKFNADVFDTFFGANFQTGGIESQVDVTTSKTCSSSRTSGMGAKDFGSLFDTAYMVTNGYLDYGSVYSNSSHPGIDLVPVGASGDVPIYALADGEIIQNSDTNTDVNGNYILQSLPDGNYAYYMHLKYRPDLKVGDKIKRGDQIGIMGNTGLSFGDHLHLQIVGSDLQTLVDPGYVLTDSGQVNIGTVIEPRK